MSSMKPLAILIAHNIELPFALGPEIGSGVDGQVFEKMGELDRVIKISMTHQSGYVQIDNTLAHMQHLWHFAKLYSYGPIFTYHDGEAVVTKTIFYVEIEKLFPLTEDERKLFHTLLSHEDANK